MQLNGVRIDIPGPDDNVHILPNMDPHDKVAVIIDGKEQFLRYSLIAAVPEMLALIKAIANHNQMAWSGDPAQQLAAFANALITKIEGKG